ncbi:DNA-binding GntR family transcriptional regulator [Paraburkholderia sp. GAS199]|uniref:GntR family transcriptional regulator n=1 Tax=Paraburkholderia sp. GAS199 TaxID=3035126 RepID=UPI003D212560
MPKKSESPSNGADNPASQTLADKATILLRKAVLNLSLEPGSRLDERVLDSQFGISRTPAREALNRLASEGLVKIEAKLGYFVPALNLGEIKSFFDAYFVEEKAIAFFCNFQDENLVDDLKRINREHAAAQNMVNPDAIQNTNTNFHLRIAEACDNDHLMAFSQQMQNHSQRLTYYIYRVERQFEVDLRGEHKLIQRQHNDIIQAIVNCDREQLSASMTAHAQQFHSRVTRILSQSNGALFQLNL